MFSSYSLHISLFQSKQRVVYPHHSQQSICTRVPSEGQTLPSCTYFYKYLILHHDHILARLSFFSSCFAHKQVCSKYLQVRGQYCLYAIFWVTEIINLHIAQNIVQPVSTTISTNGGRGLGFISPLRIRDFRYNHASNKCCCCE